MSTDNDTTRDPDLAAGSDTIPAADLPAPTDQPETQGVDPIAADLGEDGQGDLSPEDLSPEDLGPEALDDLERAEPQDLRTEAPEEGP